MMDVLVPRVEDPYARRWERRDSSKLSVDAIHNGVTKGRAAGSHERAILAHYAQNY